MLSNEAKSLIHLNIIPGIGLQTTRTLINAFGSAEQVLALQKRDLEAVDLADDVCQKFINGRSTVSVEQELELIEKFNCQVVTIDDAVYPQPLREICDPPLILYVKGEFPQNIGYSLAVVGPRRPTRCGRRLSYDIAHALTQNGLKIVNGGFGDVDTCAHRGALDAGGRTVVIMGCGLSILYPASNQQLFEKIVTSGTLISEYSMTMPPFGSNVPRRNCLISGLTLGTIVVEATECSGSLITARLAAEQGKEVFAVSGQIGADMSKGTYQLISSGAILIHSIDDLLSQLSQVGNIRPNITDGQILSDADELIRGNSRYSANANRKIEGNIKKTVSVTETASDAKEDKIVISVIGADKIHIDQIVRNANLPVHKVSGILTMLEINGIIEQLPGKFYRNLN